MKKLLSIFTVTATLIGITSCSKSEIPDTIVDTNQPVEIRVAGKALSITPNTRAPFGGLAYGSLVAKVMASNTTKKYNNSPNDLFNDGIMTFTSANESTTAKGFDGGEIPYPHASNSVYLVGLHPSTNWTVDATNGDKASFTFNGTHDVMATRQVETKKAEAASNQYKTLTFHHLLTRLNLIIQAENEDAQDSWGSVSSITVKSPFTGITVTFDPEDDATKPSTSFSGTATFFPFYNKDLDTNFTISEIPLVTSNPTAQSYSLVGSPDNSKTVPVSYDLLVKTSKHDGYSINVPLKNTAGDPFLGDARGLEFKITLTFTATDIKAFATVIGWENGGTGSGTVE